MRFSKYEPQIISEAFEELAMEGWGNVISYLLAAETGGGSIAVHRSFSAGVLSQMLKNDALKKYLISEAKKVLAEERKKDKDVTEKLGTGFIAHFKKNWHATDGVDTFSFTNLAHYRSRVGINSKLYDTKIEDFEFSFFFDADHIQACVLVLKAGDGSYFGRRIPAPSQGEAAKLFREEKSGLR